MVISTRIMILYLRLFAREEGEIIISIRVKATRYAIYHAVQYVQVVAYGGMIMWRYLMMQRIQRRSAITGLIVENSLKVQLTIGVLSLHVIKTHHTEVSHLERKIDYLLIIDSWIMRAASLRPEFTIYYLGLSQLTKLFRIYFGHWSPRRSVFWSDVAVNTTSL